MASPPLQQDLRDLLSSFNDNKVEYVVVGAFAVGVHSEPRATKDLDLFIRSSPRNAEAVYRALAQFGAPLGEISKEDFTDGKTVVQLGVMPNRADILQQISGVSFEEAWGTRETAVIDGKLEVPVLALRELLKNKEATARPQDLVDIEKLRQWNNLPAR